MANEGAIFTGNIPNFASLMKEAAQLLGHSYSGYVGEELGDREMSKAYTSGKSKRAFDDSTAKNTTNVLRSATGRLINSFRVSANGSEAYNEDGVYKVVINSSGITITVGTKVEYAAAHEFGHTYEARFIPSKGHMHKYFWAKYYATKDEKYKWMAFAVLKHGGINMKSYTLPARPFFAKANKRFQEEGVSSVLEIMAEKIIKQMENNK